MNTTTAPKTTKGPPPRHEPVEPHPDKLLAAVRDLIRSYVVVDDEPADVLALWCCHTHALDAASATPYLNIGSPVKRSGKTRLLEVLSTLVRQPHATSQISPAALARTIDQLRPTLLIDESDALSHSNELRGIINVGYRRGAARTVLERAGGGEYIPVTLSAFCPKAFAGIGLEHLPATVRDRAIPIQMHRRRPDEPVRDFDIHTAEREGREIQHQIIAWVESNIDRLRAWSPAVPSELDDRAREVWRPLLALADLARGDWPTRARAAAIKLSGQRDDDDEDAGVRLLSDIRLVFDARPEARKISSSDLLASLHELDDEGRYDDLTKIELSRALKPFGVRPQRLRFGEETVRGYQRAAFREAWRRYATGATRATQDVADVAAVAVEEQT